MDGINAWNVDAREGQTVKASASGAVERQVSAVAERQSVLIEADGLVHGDRNASYGHPLDDMSRTAGMVSAMLAHKLSAPLSAEDIAYIMCCVKLSRQINKPKRDNLVDLAGYAECADWMIEERKDRTGVR